MSASGSWSFATNRNECHAAKAFARSCRNNNIAAIGQKGLFQATQQMNYLTKEQQKVLCVIVLLLLMGLAVKTWRIAHPSQQDGIVAK
jgi:hypothetical protein